MVEPPSRRLQQILLGLKLCSPRDLRRCASRVKALSADLPAFDSVWLDALVQRRVLTSWQAQTIEADQPELLKIGPCIVEDRIGQGSCSDTYRVRLTGEAGRCVIKRVTVPTELRKSTGDRLRKLVDQSQTLSRSGIVIPHSFSEVTVEPLPELDARSKMKSTGRSRTSRLGGQDTASRKRITQAGVGRARRRNESRSRQANSQNLQSDLAIVSRLIDGLSLSEILLRRGRLPAVEVDAIARQLLESLAVLHEGGIVHGDILPGNVRLTSTGNVVLVDAGVRPALQPEFQIRSHVPPSQNDGIAPELIGTGSAATPRSDLYALGFVLWNLLAGRPAFPTGDPLAKLAAHQTQRIPDIREFAPDTPEPLAMMIKWLTEPVVSKRPRSARQLLHDGMRDRRKVTPPSVGSTDRRSEDSQRRASESGKSTSPASDEATVSVKPAGRASRRRLARFAAGFQQPLQRSAKSSSARRTIVSITCASAAVMIALAALLTFDARSRNVVLASLPQRLTRFASDLDQPADALSSSLNEADQQATRDGQAGSILTQKPAIGESDEAASEQFHQRHQKPDSKVEPAGSRTEITAAAELLPLPEPDPYGVVELSEPGIYVAGSISWPGSRLILRGPSGNPASIIVTTRPLQLRATEVTLENINLRLQPSAESPQALSQIRSQKLTCQNCGFSSPVNGHSQSVSSGGVSPGAALSTGRAVLWAPIDPSDPLAGELTLETCQFVGSHSSVVIGAPVRPARCSNTLKLGGGPLFIATDRAASGDNTFELVHSTLRDCGSLVALDLRASPPWNSRLTIRQQSSVFDLRGRTSDESESLITFVGGQLQRIWHERVQFDGEASVASEGVGLAAWQAPNGASHQLLDAADVSVRGLIQTHFTFQSVPSGRRSDSVLSDVHTNRASSRLPGISSRSAEGSLPDPAMDLLQPVPEPDSGR